MSVNDLITILTPLATHLIREIFVERRQRDKLDKDVKDKIDKIQGILADTKNYLGEIKDMGYYLSNYLKLGSSAEKMVDIVGKLHFLNQATLRDVSLFDSLSQISLNDLQQIFDQEINPFSFKENVHAQHRDTCSENKGNMISTLKSISNERSTLSDRSKNKKERKTAKENILRHLERIKRLANIYIGYKNVVFDSTINRLMLGK